MRQFISSGYQREVGSNPSASVMLSGRASAQTKNPVSRVMGSNLFVTIARTHKIKRHHVLHCDKYGTQNLHLIYVKKSKNTFLIFTK